MPAVMKNKSTRGWNRTPYKKSTTAKVATLTKQVRAIKKSQELKWFDVNLASATGGAVEPLNNVPLGDDATARDGRKIIMKSVNFKLWATGTMAGALSTMPRLAIVYDKANNGLLPAATDIFTSTASTAQVNLNNRDRFKILYDNHGGLNKGTDPYRIYSTGSTTFIVNDYVKLRDLETIYSDTGSGTIAGTRTGALYAVFLGTGAVAGLDASFRTRFLDS